MVGCERFAASTVLTLEGGDRGNRGQRCQLLEPFDRVRQVDPDRLRRRRRDAVLRAALAATARERSAGRLWTAAGARLTLLSYQLEPALAVLDGATRVLLADEVGLGKTIQAGLILSELRARGLVERALILAPAGLRETWATELRDRFELRADVLDQAAIAERSAVLPANVNPWTMKGIIITSVDFAKREEVLAAIEEAPFDLVIADEAHHLTPGSDRGAAVSRVASRVPWVILVSATPHSGDDAAFTYLTGLGSLDDRLKVFRRSRKDAGIADDRHTHLLAVRPHAVEEEMLRGTERYARAIWHARGALEPGVRLVAMTLARRAASSPAALCRTLTRRLALMTGTDDPSPRQPRLPWEDIDMGDDDDAVWLGCAGLEDRLAEQRQVEELIVLARTAGLDTAKTRRLLRLLECADQPAVVFTEYRDTLEALQQVLEPVRSIAVIHGGLAPAVRQDNLDRFGCGQASVLIATDAAGEGLNLHHRCRLVINIELPWNPLRLEQRVGRVDRIGQSRRVHAVHLVHRGGIEETVLARLERRRLRAERGLGDECAWLSSDDIAQTALGEEPAPARVAPRILTSRVARAAAERSRAETQRRLRKLCDEEAGDAYWGLPRRRSPGSSRVILLHLVHHLDADWRVRAEHYLPLAVDLGVTPRNRQEWRIVIDALARRADIRHACAVESEACAMAASRAIRPLALAVTSRIERIQSRLRRTPTPWRQVSLFDRRSERLAEARQHVRARLDAHLEQRLDQLSGGAGVSIRLIAAWAAESGR